MRRQRPLSAPTAAELQSHPTIWQALQEAWQDSLPDDPARRHEEGGWIYMDVMTGEISVHRQVAGRQASIDLSRPQDPSRLCRGWQVPHPSQSFSGGMGARAKP